MSAHLRHRRRYRHHYHQAELLDGEGLSRSHVDERLLRSAKAGGVFRRDPEFFGRDRATLQRARSEGRDRFRKKMHVRPVLFEFGHDGSLQEHSFAVESRTGIAKTSGKPIKTLINEEMSKGTETRWQSPNLVARLMGLDSLPPQNVREQPSKAGGHSRKASFWGNEENWVSYEGYSHSINGDDDDDDGDDEQDFKDVYEVLQTSGDKNVKHLPVQSGKLSSRSKRYDIDMAYTRKRFLDAKHLSTDEALSSSSGVDDALYVIDSNKEQFSNFPEEPTSLFSKHLHDLKRCPPSPTACNITILKSTAAFHERGEIYDKSERKLERHRHISKEVNSSVKPLPTLVDHHLKEQCSPKSEHLGKNKDGSHPTRIVVLKPSLKNPQEQKCARSSSPKTQDHIFRHGCHWELRHSGMQELYSEARERQKVSDNDEDVLPKPKSSREIARHIMMQMRDNVTSSNRNVLSSEFNGSIREKIACSMPDMDDLNNSQTFRWSADDFNELDFNSSPYAESSLSREARKRLCDRWKMTRPFQEIEPLSRGSSTLAEMLALSDREAPRTDLCSGACPNFSARNMPLFEASAPCRCSSSINSRDGWKHGKLKKLARTAPAPSYWNTYRSTKFGRRKYLITNEVENHNACGSHNENLLHRGSMMGIYSKCQFSDSYPYSIDGEDNKPPEREIHVSEEVFGSNPGAHYSKEKALTSDLFDGNELDIYRLEEDQAAHYVGPQLSSLDDNKQTKQADLGEIIEKNEDTSSEHVQVKGLPLVDHQTKSVAAEIYKEFDGPSPISVLDHLEEEKMDSECFEKINADLKELRLQLQLLKMDSDVPYIEELEVSTICGDKYNKVDSSLRLQLTKTKPEFTDKIDMEHTYLLDILIVSGLHGSKCGNLAYFSNLAHDPIGLHVFEHLELKYSNVNTWSRSDRKLLFDLVNCVLAEKVASGSWSNAYVNSKQRMHESAHNDVAEDLWQMLDDYREELKANQEDVLAPSWLILNDDMRALGHEMERMLKDELLEEIVSEMYR